MNKRTNKHRNDVTRADSIAIDQHFNQNGHDFNRDFRVIIIEEITKKNLTKDQRTALICERYQPFDPEARSPPGYLSRYDPREYGC